MRRNRSRRTYPCLRGVATLMLHLATSPDSAAGTPSLHASALAPIQPLNAREAAALADAGISLHLSVRLNGRTMGLQPAQLRGGHSVWMQHSVLTAMGMNLQAMPANARQEAGWLALDSLDDASLQLDPAAQTLALLVPFPWLDWDSTQLNTHSWLAPHASASTGLLLNYDVHGFGALDHAGPRSLGAATELRAFRANTVLSHTMLAQARHALALEDGAQAGHRYRNTRLDTSLVHSMPDSLLMLRLGDTLTAQQPWSRATRIGGLQIGTHFSLQPYRPTTPMAALTGTTTLPSGVELFINGVRQYQGQVPAGPFTLNTLPGITGSGQAHIVMTDMLGRQSTMEYSLYGNSQLLAQGLSDWSVELGRIREQYGIRSFQYGTGTMASFTLSHGLTNTVTLQGHAELTGKLRNAGMGGIWAWGQWGVMSLAAARSTSQGLSGTLLQAGYNYANRHFHASLQGRRASSGYRDAAALRETHAMQSMAHTIAGFTTPAWGSVSAGFTYMNQGVGSSQRYATLSWSKPIGRRAHVALKIHHSLRDRQQSTAQLLLSWFLDGDISTGASIQPYDRGGQLTLHASQRQSQDTGWGWSTSAQGGSSGHARAHVNYRAQSTELNAGLARTGHSMHASLGASGALAWLSGLDTPQVFASRRITDSFAVVDTGATAGVPVRRDNTPVGVSNARGLLLVPQLGAYRTNRISIDPTQLPAQMRVAEVEKVISPTDRAGVAVRFALQQIRAASIVLHDAQARPLPLGTVVRLWHTGDTPSDTRPTLPPQTPPQARSAVGYDGIVYFETLGPQNLLLATTPDNATCSSHVVWLHSTPNEIPLLGPATCE